MSRPPFDPHTAPREAAARIAHGHALSRLGDWGQAAERYHAAIDLAPDNPEAHFHLATAQAQLGDLHGAIDSLHSALAFAPNHGGARTNLAHLLRASDQAEAALEEYRRALYLNPGDAALRFHIGGTMAAADRWEEAAVWFTQAAEARHLPAFAALATLQLQLGQPGEALRWFRMARQAGDNSANARLGEALSLLTLGHLKPGWDGYEARPVPSPFLGGRDAALRWDGTKDIRGKTLLVWAEQGLGDSIMFARYLPLLRQRGARVLLSVQAPLLPLMEGLADRIVPEGSTITFDMHCPLPSLPRAFGTELATIPARTPYIYADIERLKRWRPRLGPAPRRASAWFGPATPTTLATASVRSPATTSCPCSPCPASPGTSCRRR
jgi:Tfp pilus assembly protein PilF